MGCIKVNQRYIPTFTFQVYIWSPMPHVIFGSMALVGIVVGYFLPETLGEYLPDTIDDVQNLGTQR